MTVRAAHAPPRRILYVDHTPFVGGAELVLAQHLRALDRARFRPFVACTDTVPSLIALYRASGAEVHVLDMPPLRRLDPRVLLRLARAAGALRALVHRLDIDLVVTNTSRAAYLATVALCRMRVPLVWWVRDFLFNRAVFRVLRRAPAAILCVSDAIRRYYAETTDPRCEVIHVGSPMHEDLANLSPDRVRAARQRWGYRDDDLVIGFMGRLVEEKGAEDVVLAAAGLHARDPRVKALLVGTGKGQASDIEDRLRRTVEERGWPFVTFAGFQSDEALFYSMFDVFVLATRTDEPYATSVVQAMMAGTPVVATATGGTPELVRHGETGMLVPPSSPERMAHAIGALLADAELRRRMIETARDHVLRHNLESVTTRQAERCFAKVLAGAQR